MAGGLLVTVLLVVSMCLQRSLQGHPPLKNIALRDAQRVRVWTEAELSAPGNLSDSARNGLKGDCFFTDGSRARWITPMWKLHLKQMYTIQNITVHACGNDVDSLRGVEVSVGWRRVGTFPSNHTPALVTSFTDLMPMEGQSVEVEKKRGVGQYFSVAEVEVWAYQCDDARYYGEQCDQPCGKGCYRDTCDSVTGICRDNSSPSCRQGFKTTHSCDQVCDKGTYGSKCAYVCGSGCLDGACNNTNGYCQCLKGWTGSRCDDIDDCQSDPCGFGGDCVDRFNSYKCRCFPGFSGRHCEQDIDECQFDPCENAAFCLDGINSYTCQCLPGFTGRRCERDIDDCESDPCGKGGYCSDGINSYTCRCRPGFSGHRCEQDIDDCLSSPCENGGQCQDGVNSYTCQCPPRYTGLLCEQAVDVCQLNPCDNGGRCQGGLDSYTCLCLAGFTGHHCQQGCEAGRYGYHCRELCGRCRDSDQCDVITGDCPAGCEDGFHGTRCADADDFIKLYIVVGDAAIVIALVAVVSVLVCRSRRAGQVPRTGGNRTEYLDLEEAGTQNRFPEQKMDSNRPTLPEDEEGVYSNEVGVYSNEEVVYSNVTRSSRLPSLR